MADKLDTLIKKLGNQSMDKWKMGMNANDYSIELGGFSVMIFVNRIDNIPNYHLILKEGDRVVDEYREERAFFFKGGIQRLTERLETKRIEYQEKQNGLAVDKFIKDLEKYLGSNVSFESSESSKYKTQDERIAERLKTLDFDKWKMEGNNSNLSYSLKFDKYQIILTRDKFVIYEDTKSILEERFGYVGVICYEKLEEIRKEREEQAKNCALDRFMEILDEPGEK